MRYTMNIDFPGQPFGEPEKNPKDKLPYPVVPRILVLHFFNVKSKRLEIDRPLN